MPWSHRKGLFWWEWSPLKQPFPQRGNLSSPVASLAKSTCCTFSRSIKVPYQKLTSFSHHIIEAPQLDRRGPIWAQGGIGLEHISLLCDHREICLFWPLHEQPKLRSIYRATTAPLFKLSIPSFQGLLQEICLHSQCSFGKSRRSALTCEDCAASIFHNPQTS